jgi:hypothetical protein
MTKEEWRELVKHIYHQSIEPKIRQHRKNFHPFHWVEDFPYGVDRLMRAMRALRFIEANFDEDDDLTKYLTLEFLQRTLDELSEGLNLNRRYVMDTGIAEVIEEFFEEIVDGMDTGDIPEQDIEALKLSGSVDPRAELQLSMMRLKKKKEIIIRRNKEGSISYTVKQSEERIQRRKEQIKESNSNRPPRKKIFKGLGSICKGAMLTVVDVSLVAGMWPLGLSVETTTVGAVVSITTGLGDILNGVGEMRGE